MIELDLLQKKVESFTNEEYDNFILENVDEFFEDLKKEKINFNVDFNSIAVYDQYIPFKVISKYKKLFNWRLLTFNYCNNTLACELFEEYIKWDLKYPFNISGEILNRHENQITCWEKYHVDDIDNVNLLKKYCNKLDWRVYTSNLNSIVQKYKICKNELNIKNRKNIKRKIKENYKIIYEYNKLKESSDCTTNDIDNNNYFEEVNKIKYIKNLDKPDKLFNNMILSHGIITNFKNYINYSNDFSRIINNFKMITEQSNNIIISCSNKTQNLGILGFYINGENLLVSNFDIDCRHNNYKNYFYEAIYDEGIVFDRNDYNPNFLDSHAEHLVTNFNIKGIWIKEEFIPLFYKIYKFLKEYCLKNNLIFNVIPIESKYKFTDIYKEAFNPIPFNKKCPICNNTYYHEGTLDCDIYNLECCPRCKWFEHNYVYFHDVLNITKDEWDCIKIILKNYKIEENEDMNKYFDRILIDLNKNDSNSKCINLTNLFIERYNIYISKI